MTTQTLNELLTIGIVQTSLDHISAWQENDSQDWRKAVRISEVEEIRAKKEIRHFLSYIHNSSTKKRPDLILFPELSVPIGFLPKLIRATEKLKAIVIAGLDYCIDEKENNPTVSNDAVVIVPKKIRDIKIASRTEIRFVGKTYPAPKEKRRLEELKPSVKFKPHPTIWVFDGGNFGKFGVAVCYDFMDLDRIVMYRNQIQSLFILAYNRDTTSFDHISEAISRMVFCNVAVCNCGKFGGSLGVTPYKKPYKRLVYRHAGQELPNAQIIQFPLREIAEHQSENSSRNLKSLPPGFDNST